jgi:hypothetical protein
MPEREEEPTMVVVPIFTETDHWKTVELQIKFGIAGEPLVIDVDMSNLIEIEKKHLKDLFGWSLT